MSRLTPSCYEEGGKRLYFLGGRPEFLFSAMTPSDLNFWGELVVPVGLTICFGPALLVWFLQEWRAKPETTQQQPPAKPDSSKH